MVVIRAAERGVRGRGALWSRRRRRECSCADEEKEEGDMPVGGSTLLTNTNIAWARVREGGGVLDKANDTFSELSLMRLRMT